MISFGHMLLVWGLCGFWILDFGFFLDTLFGACIIASLALGRLGYDNDNARQYTTR